MSCGAKVPRGRRRRRRVRDVDSYDMKLAAGKTKSEVWQRKVICEQHLHLGTETRNGCGFSLEQLLRPFVASRGFEKENASTLFLNKSFFDAFRIQFPSPDPFDRNGPRRRWGRRAVKEICFAFPDGRLRLGTRLVSRVPQYFHEKFLAPNTHDVSL